METPNFRAKAGARRLDAPNGSQSTETNSHLRAPVRADAIGWLYQGKSLTVRQEFGNQSQWYLLIVWL